MTLEELRARIDGIDRQLVALLAERARCAQEIGGIKRGQQRQIFDPQREEQVLQAVCALNPGPLDDQALRAIYQTIMTQMKTVE